MAWALASPSSVLQSQLTGISSHDGERVFPWLQEPHSLFDDFLVQPGVR